MPGCAFRMATAPATRPVPCKNGDRVGAHGDGGWDSELKRPLGVELKDTDGTCGGVRRRRVLNRRTRGAQAAGVGQVASFGLQALPELLAVSPRSCSSTGSLRRNNR